MLSPGQAANRLKEIEQTERRSGEAHIYANASPGFILWGVIWVLGYAGSDLLRRHGDGRSVTWLWDGLVVAGIGASIAIGRRRHRGQPRHAGGWRWGATFLVLWAFIIATLALMAPANPAITGAFVPLIVATAYAVFGIWKGPRFLYAGIAVAALTLFGFFCLADYFLLWMAGVGGGTLVLTGLWLRTI